MQYKTTNIDVVSCASAYSSNFNGDKKSKISLKF